MIPSGRLLARVLRKSRPLVGQYATAQQSLPPAITAACTYLRHFENAGMHEKLFSRSFSASAVSRSSTTEFLETLKREISDEQEENSCLENPPSGWIVDLTEGGSRLCLKKKRNSENIIVTVDYNDQVGDFDSADEEMDEDGKRDGEDVDAGDLTITPTWFDVDITKGDDKLKFRAGYDGEHLSIHHVHHGDPREGIYSGPRFDELDEELQHGFAEYLEERGINLDFGDYIMQAFRDKEAKEYFRWLRRVKKFVET